MKTGRRDRWRRGNERRRRDRWNRQLQVRKTLSLAPQALTERGDHDSRHGADVPVLEILGPLHEGAREEGTSQEEARPEDGVVLVGGVLS